jgi:hypothetical protein
MPVKTYEDQFKATLQHEVIEKSVKRTANVATDFFYKMLHKEKKNAGTQSLTIKQITAEQSE